MTFHRAVTIDDLWSGEKVGVEVCGKPVLLVNVGGVVCAYEDRCRHKGVRLSEGRLDGSVLTCAAHGWEYDVLTGRGVNPEATVLTRYGVRIEGHDVLVDLPQGEDVRGT
jgi:toluene monooxygenase system ferredoxin subunit